VCETGFSGDAGKVGGVAMTRTEIREVKDQLLEYRSLLMRQISETTKSIREASAGEFRDTGDRIWKINTSNLWSSQGSLRSHRLQLVEDALKRIDQGTFGTCQDCEKAIEEKRLRAIPWARLCLKCQEAAEALESIPLGSQQIATEHLWMA